MWFKNGIFKSQQMCICTTYAVTNKNILKNNDCHLKSRFDDILGNQVLIVWLLFIFYCKFLLFYPWFVLDLRNSYFKLISVTDNFMWEICFMPLD